MLKKCKINLPADKILYNEDTWDEITEEKIELPQIKGIDNVDFTEEIKLLGELKGQL